jgi:hypothetical protein
MVYHELFPNAVCPHYWKSASVDRRLQDTGTLAMNRHNTWRGPSICTPSFDRDVLQLLEDNPSTKTRAVAHELRVDLRRCGTFYANNISVLSIGPTDFVLRDQFVRWFVWQSTEKSEFLAIFIYFE